MKQISRNKFGFLLTAFVTWFITSLILCLVSAAILSGIKLDMKTIGYTSSALSFFAAAAAGIAAMRRRKSKALITGLISGVLISLLLLVLGFIIGGMEFDGMISSTAFTIAGAVTGSVFCPTGNKKSGK